MRERWKRRLEGVLLPAALLMLWQAVASSGLVAAQLLPSPLAVLHKWWTYLAPPPAAPSDPVSWLLSSELLGDVLGSLSRVLCGFGLALLLALPLGLLMGAVPRVYRICNPLLQVLRPIPPIAYIPLAILWFGLGNPPAIFLIVLGAFFPLLMSTMAGVQHIDGIYLRVARNLGASPRTIFVRVMLPAAAPHILSGMRVGMGTAFIVVIVAEMIAVNGGLGFRILEAREYFWSDKIMAGMLTIGLLGLAIDLGMNKLSHHLLRWHRGLEP
jgi:NitT/TauT family transport system permease protein